MAMSARGEVRRHHVIADLDAAHAGAEGDDVADELVSDDRADLDPFEIAGHDMKIGATDACERYANERIVRIDQFGRGRVP